MTMTRIEFERWQAFPDLSPEEQATLRDLAKDPTRLEEAFKAPMRFGTAGLRGKMSMGPAYMNRFTVAWATAGVARWLQEMYPQGGSVVIARDNRLHSSDFACVTAEVLAAFGFTPIFWQPMVPSPVLSWSVPLYSALAGIVITASHNPAQYNGYKVYDATGCQLLNEAANAVSAYAAPYLNGSLSLPKVSDFDDLVAKGTIRLLGVEDLCPYLDTVLNTVQPCLPDTTNPIRVVYSPLHGTGGIATPEALQRTGFEVLAVRDQMGPDGHFPTLATPNPEDPAAYALALDRAKASKADVVIVNDPDCDRMGAALRIGDTYQLLTGNQIGALLIDYITTHCNVGQRNLVITSNVSSPFGKRLAESRGLRVEETLTGFKYIGERMNILETESDPSPFLFGYEESYGYLFGDYARDKDGVIAALLMACAVQAAKNKGVHLLDHLKSLYEETGYFVDELVNVDLEALGGREAGLEKMDELRLVPPAEIAGVPVSSHLDYKQGILSLPKENLLQYHLVDGSVIGLRPSGTEPIIKCYINARAETLAQAQAAAESFSSAFTDWIRRM